MSTLEIRPRFELSTPLSKDEVLRRLDESLKKPESYFKGYITDWHVVLKIPSVDDHFWSPQLSMDVVEKEDGAMIYGLIGPKPSVWLMFVFFYFFLGFTLMVIAVIGFSRYNLGLSAGILWLLPIISVVLVSVYLSANFGKKLGRDQMEKLVLFVKEISES
jgi:hypothetical protein